MHIFPFTVQQMNNKLTVRMVESFFLKIVIVLDQWIHFVPRHNTIVDRNALYDSHTYHDVD